MDTVADDIISGWCDLDPKTRYRVAAAVVRLFERPNDKAPYEWASLTRQLLLKAPDPDAVFNEIVDRLHPTSVPSLKYSYFSAAAASACLAALILRRISSPFAFHT